MIKKILRDIWGIRRLPEAIAVTLGLMDVEETEEGHVQINALGRITASVFVGLFLLIYWAAKKIFIKPTGT